MCWNARLTVSSRRPRGLGGFPGQLGAITGPYRRCHHACLVRAPTLVLLCASLKWVRLVQLPHNRLSADAHHALQKLVDKYKQLQKDKQVLLENIQVRAWSACWTLSNCRAGCKGCLRGVLCGLLLTCPEDSSWRRIRDSSTLAHT